MQAEKEISVYIHWPFCKLKCPYCDFNSFVRQSIDHSLWQESYKNAISHYKPLLTQKKIKSIYFGGGTPSLMEPKLVSCILDSIADTAALTNETEITLEANPTSTEATKLRAFQNAGINRISLGVQSLNDADLKFLGRDHSAKEALDTLNIVADLFDNYSFDLIYALPKQKLKEWELELERALRYAKYHLSLYQLTIEQGTRFYQDHRRGVFNMPNDELSADFYQATSEITASAGFRCYEVSNYAKSNFESKHNMTYWQCKDYIGIGPGACGRYQLDGKVHCTEDHKNPKKWLENLKDKGHGIEHKNTLNAVEKLQDEIMMGLRLAEGIPATLLKNNSALENLLNLGLLIQYEQNIKASKDGVLVLNKVIEMLFEGIKH